MAVTSLWKVTGWIGKVLGYAMNPDKAEAPPEEYEAHGIGEALIYATNPNKTEQQLFVTGVNCLPETSLAEMSATKHEYAKADGIVAFHGYQSFSPGEVTPEVAHRIGVMLAQELWGERFEVVVATHLDKDHLHNHFVINSVSFTDGKRFHRDNACYRAMRTASDKLCAEYNLSVIHDPKPGKAKHYGEWNAEREGRQTWRGLVKADVDEAVERAMTDKQFFANLRAIGYEIKTGKDISVRPPGKERFVRLGRNFGDDYTYEGINARILANKRSCLAIKKTPHTASLSSKKKVPLPKGSLIGLYRHYKYLFGCYNTPNAPNKRMHFLLREDLCALNAITQELVLLERESIETTSQLKTYAQTLLKTIESLTGTRKAIRTEARRANIPTDAAHNPHIAEINNRLNQLRKEVGLCKNIEERSLSLPTRIETIEGKNANRAPSKEDAVGRNRSGGRTDRADDARG